MVPAPVRVTAIALISLVLVALTYFFGYLLYFAVADAWAGNPRDISGTELPGLQVLFYAVFLAGLVAAVAAAWTLAPRAGVSRAVSTSIVMFIVGVLAWPLLAFLSFMNVCRLDHSFPFPGASC